MSLSSTRHSHGCSQSGIGYISRASTTPLMTTLSPTQDSLRAGLFMVAAAASFVTNDTFVKLLDGTVPVGEIIAVRGAFSAMLLAAACSQRKLFFATPLVLARSVLARSAFDLVATVLFIVA